MSTRFRLSESFLEPYKLQRPLFGFNGLGEFVYNRTYSRIQEDGTNEVWWETIRRVVEGTYNIQRRYITENRLGWNAAKAQKSAQEMYDRMFNMKFLPPGRGLWAMGSPLTEDLECYAALNNCAFVSTETIKEDLDEPFAFLMDGSMLGIGVGFDVKGAGKVEVKGFNEHTTEFQISDSREGWVDSVKLLIRNAFLGLPKPVYDYSLIRVAGLPIKGFGGMSSGPEPLEQLHKDLIDVFEKNRGLPLTIRTIVDTMNMIGRCVVAGNVRRTAEIVFGPYNEDEYLNLKDYRWDSEKKGYVGESADRAAYGWTSNNSVFADLGMDYTRTGDQAGVNGEPGFAWLENMQRFGRMADPANNKDHRVRGGNPCITGDTLIAVADGRNAVPIQELVGTTFPVYTIKDKKVTIGQVLKVWKTRVNAEIWKLTLDDGTELKATPDHQIMLRDGTFLPLKDLVPGQSLMPFNSYVSNKHYRQIASNTGRDRRQYRMIVEFGGLIVDPKTTAIHHMNFDSFDDRLENLQGLPHEDHRQLHAVKMLGSNNPMCNPDVARRAIENRDFSGHKNPMFGKQQSDETKTVIGLKSKQNWQNQRDNMRLAIQNGMTPELCERISAARRARGGRSVLICKICGCEKEMRTSQVARRETCSRSCANRLRHQKKVANYNHKVVSVEFLGFDDVYDMTVTDTHNFGVITSQQDQRAITSSGIFIHNCLEQSLESFELCCLVETYPDNHDSLEDFKRTLKFAYLYAKTVTLGKTHWEKTNRVMLRNRRIGCSMSGIQQFIAKHGIHTFKKWCNDGYATIAHYDDIYSDWFAIPRSIKMTSVKPSGTVSLLAGATPGMHWPASLYYTRRVRLTKVSPLVKAMKQAGYVVEPASESPKDTVVVEIPVHIDDCGGRLRTVGQVSMWEQVTMAAFIQKWWADNQVSCTVTFDPDLEGGMIKHALNYFQYDLKGISFLPRVAEGAYAQMPYEEIDANAYAAASAKLKPINFGTVAGVQAEVERFCDGASCVVG